MALFMKLLGLVVFGSLLAGYTASATYESFQATYAYPLFLAAAMLSLIASFRVGAGVLGGVGAALSFAMRLVGTLLKGALHLLAALVAGLFGLAGGGSGARFMGRLERWRLLNRWHRGFLIDGRHGRLGLTPSFQSCVTVAGQGAGKSSACVIPNLLTLDGCSLVITDTKGSVYQQTSGDLARRGFAIKVLNLMEPTRSHPYNPLARLRTPLQVLKAIDLIYAARGGRSADPFWDDGAKRLLRILAQCLINRGDPVQATLANVKHLLDQFDAHRRDGSRLDRFVVESTLDDPQTFADYRGLVGATPERTLLSFVTEAATALRLLASPEIAALLAGDGFDFAALRQRKTALYILVRQQDMESYGFILNLDTSENPPI
jgi:type IV secretion system protein VirD4